MIIRFQNSSLLEKDNEYRPLLFYSSGPEKGKSEPFPTGQKGIVAIKPGNKGDDSLDQQSDFFEN